MYNHMYLILLILLIAYLWSRESFYNVNRTRLVTLHYANWSGPCRLMKPVWEKVKRATINSGIIFREIDEDIAHTPGITGYPTIIMLMENGHAKKYEGGFEFHRLRNWVTQV